jgi:hypothetical protein
MDPPEWIRPLLGIDLDAFNHGDTPEFAAISAVAVRHNTIVTFDSSQGRFANPNGPFAQAVSQIGQALRSGDLNGAQQAL